MSPNLLKKERKDKMDDEKKESAGEFGPELTADDFEISGDLDDLPL